MQARRHQVVHAQTGVFLVRGERDDKRRTGPALRELSNGGKNRGIATLHVARTPTQQSVTVERRSERRDGHAVNADGVQVTIQHQGRPLSLQRSHNVESTRRDLDPRLIAGAAVFGLGWGLAGLCPGPALTLLTVAPAQAVTFVVAMVVGMLAFHLLPAAAPKPAVQGADA